MAKTPTFLDYLNLRDELRGVTGHEERRAIIAKHVEAAALHFRRNHVDFPLDYESPRARELWAGVEETAEELVRGEKTEGHLSGSVSAWKVTICEEYLDGARAVREAELRAEAGVPDERSPVEEPKEVAAGEAANDGEQSPPKPRRRAPTRPAKTPSPTPPADSPQGFLFG